MPTLLDYLAGRFPQAKRTTLRRMVEAGRVCINGRRARGVNAPVGEADSVEVSDAPPARAKAPSIAPLSLVHEDEHVLVVIKPPGLLTSTVPRERRPTAAAILRRYLAVTSPRARLGVIHRLDRDASGLLVFSKGNTAYESLKRQFFEHSVKRVYLAIVDGAPSPTADRIESKLVELPDGTVRTTRNRGAGQHAVTDYVVVRQARRRALVRATLHTGRKHQIRAHLSERGWPVVGDPMYGGKQGGAPRLLLAAVELEFVHPHTGESMRFEASLPREFAAALDGS